MRPNILLILVDSARTDAYRLNGGAADAPALERLAAEGVNVSQARATCPICHPSRASIITGLYPFAHGMLTNGHFASGPAFYVRPETPMLPELLQAAGYRTGYAGQMHVVARGWDEDRHCSTRHFARRLKDKGFTEAPLPEERGWHCGLVHYGVDDTREGQFTARGLELLDDLCAGDQPWFMQLDYDGPHLPCYVPEPYASRYNPDALPLPPTSNDNLAGRPHWIRQAQARQGWMRHTEAEQRRLNAFYHGELTMIDDLVGRVLDRLDQHGQAANTLVVFTSDHATPVGYHGFVMHGGPALYEDVLRVPCAVRWPAGLPAGQACDGAFQHVDLVPTFLAAAGAPAIGCHGRDALAMLRGEAHDVPDQSYHVYSGTGTGFFSVRAFRDGAGKLVYTPFGESEVYDLAADPLETVNLAGQGTEMERSLRAGMLAEMERVGDPLGKMAKGELAG